MLSENVFVNTEITNKKINDEIEAVWVCPNCGTSFTINSDSIDNLIDSDPHDPLFDYLICSYCGDPTSLANKVKVTINEDNGFIYADGSYIYIEHGEEVERIL